MAVKSQPYSPVALCSQKFILLLISVRGIVDPMAIVWLEGLGQLNPMTSSEIELAIFWLVA
jgi:hypothetical protein